MDELAKNLGPPLGVALVTLIGWLYVRHLSRQSAAEAEKRRTPPAE